MPRRDKTGPDGKGPLTGRGAGGCSVSDIAGKVDDRVGGIFGAGGRRGRRGRGRN